MALAGSRVSSALIRRPDAERITILAALGRSPRRRLLLLFAAALLLLASRLRSARSRLAVQQRLLEARDAVAHHLVLARTRMVLQLNVRRVLLHVRARTAATLERSVEGVLDKAAQQVRATLKDEAMPALLQRGVDQFVDALLPDVKQECWRWTDERLMPAVGSRSPRTSLSPLSPRIARAHSRLEPDVALARPPLLLLRRARAFTLHTLWPHDRSFWSCTRSGRWWVLQLTGMLPFVGQLWWLLLASAVDKQDEYQLCNFIVGLRCQQFATLGLGAAGYACVLAYRSALLHAAAAAAAAASAASAAAAASSPTAAAAAAATLTAAAAATSTTATDAVSDAFSNATESAWFSFGIDPLGGAPSATYIMMGPDAAPLPQLSLWGAAFWAVQVALGWRAFALLPSSHKKGQRVRFERRARLPFASRLALAAADTDAPTNHVMGNGGGTPVAAAEAAGGGDGGGAVVNGDGGAERGGGGGGAGTAAGATTRAELALQTLQTDGGAAARRGGVLMHLRSFDLWLATAALLLAAAAAACAPGQRALRLSLFWVRTCHGLLCCPYLLFKLPVLDTLLTHARKTGYDTLGHTVPFRVLGGGDGAAASARAEAVLSTAAVSAKPASAADQPRTPPQPQPAMHVTPQASCRRRAAFSRVA